ncbi:MAG: hypothetical protein AAF412_00955 [Pseudomonadota bacterium]
MIRIFTVMAAAMCILTACASGRIANSPQGYRPASFTIQSVNIDVVDQNKPSRSFMQLMRTAANNARVAYNKEAGHKQAVYNLELSLNRLTVDKEAVPILPITNNVIEMMAVLRSPTSGVAMRTVPVRYQLVALNPDETREKQLLRGSLPKAFNGLYGMTRTPGDVASLIESEKIFVPRRPKPVVRKSKPRQPQNSALQTDVVISPETQDDAVLPPIDFNSNAPANIDAGTVPAQPASGGSEPKVITCDIC